MCKKHSLSWEKMFNKSKKIAMQAIFTITGAELSPTLFEQIKSLFQGEAHNFEVVIRVKSKETQEEGRKRLEQRMLEMERDENVVKFTGDEFDTLAKQLSKR
jgi:divalent metal cation (Fe/Co/Zn/Cd) transporter